MFKKIFIGILLISVIGAGTAAFMYQASQSETSTLPEPLAQAGSGVGQQQNATGTSQGTPIAQGMEGEPWEATGTVASVDDYGFDMVLETGETVYIELGPPDYWQAQGILLEAGQSVTVVGSNNEGMIHAAQVQLADGQTLMVRDTNGQPLWSGGATNGQGQGGQGAGTGSADGSHTTDPQAQVDEWITISGTIMAYDRNWMTISTDDGQVVSFQTGQPRFFAEQGVTFQVGDEVIVVGFYQADQFTAGDITQVSTGLRVMLRDPNGRPLWAGPGNGNGNGGNGGNGGGK